MRVRVASRQCAREEGPAAKREAHSMARLLKEEGCCTWMGLIEAKGGTPQATVTGLGGQNSTPPEEAGSRGGWLLWPSLACLGGLGNLLLGGRCLLLHLLRGRRRLLLGLLGVLLVPLVRLLARLFGVPLCLGRGLGLLLLLLGGQDLALPRRAELLHVELLVLGVEPAHLSVLAPELLQVLARPDVASALELSLLYEPALTGARVLVVAVGALRPAGKDVGRPLQWALLADLELVEGLNSIPTCHR
mmetsp:Transcript_8852/g.21956  ORF Transcript_8852/g.21956 Transcript_8852/m.21956 type:complete len:247 (+) Transcript_8852:145-885(+)